MRAEVVLPGWALFFSEWEVKDEAPLAEPLIAGALERLRGEFAGREISADPVVQAVRKLFRAAGTDPTRYRPSFEALARRMFKGEPFPRIHPAVDLANVLSLQWHVPCCVADRDKVVPPVRMRVGAPSETVESLRGPFSLEGKPLLEDANGVYSTPITDSRRASVGPGVRRALFVAYVPEEAFDGGRAEAEMAEWLARAPQLGRGQ
jgi:DNA/RNA-binding domain of Phe-tRNA-synthetase-like protein